MYVKLYFYEENLNFKRKYATMLVLLSKRIRKEPSTNLSAKPNNVLLALYIKI